MRGSFRKLVQRLSRRREVALEFTLGNLHVSKHNPLEVEAVACA